MLGRREGMRRYIATEPIRKADTVIDSVEADSFLAAKEALGFELSGAQHVMNILNQETTA